jgi:hypothetical protein
MQDVNYTGDTKKEVKILNSNGFDEITIGLVMNGKLMKGSERSISGFPEEIDSGIKKYAREYGVNGNGGNLPYIHNRSNLWSLRNVFREISGTGTDERVYRPAINV